MIRLLGIALISCVTLVAKSYTVGVQNFTEYMPYSQYYDGKYSGFNRDLLDAFAESYGFTFIYEAAPPKRLQQMLLLGKVDFKYPDNVYWGPDSKKDKMIYYSQPVVRYVDGVIVLSSNLGKGVENLKTLGTVIGFTPYAYLEFIQKGSIKLHENPSYMGLLRQIIRGHVDGAYVNIAVSRYYFQKETIDHQDESVLVFDAVLPHTRSTRHLSTMAHPGLIRVFDQWMEQNQDMIDALKEKYEVEKGI